MSLDRDALITALETLSDADDATALAAARTIAAQVGEADLEWTDLIVSRLPGTEPAARAPLAELGQDDESVQKAIAAMLERPNLHDGTREDLEAYQTDLAAGELEPEDRQYVLALYQRLNG